MGPLQITEFIEIDLSDEVWRCRRCTIVLGPVTRPYQDLCLVHDRDPDEVHLPPVTDPQSVDAERDWVRILELYCPGCGALVETIYTTPGDAAYDAIEIDLVPLKAKLAAGELLLRDGGLHTTA